ncbi:hypothetical protein HYPSUDRAFT_143064 [Hypholoma sublateritium FD-334 SS-4]|uniref:RING-type domain-containing protein n=1 Tax=Hypholoma sublateritium (strain FD-334 SS-4) TaxID=945553 RepID=A0A0D2NLW7_HYPSF|nr:hypothetical protein HYPSUDRAFT_143064 [Hypholoma sublateritium FD-334 SS-4]
MFWLSLRASIAVGVLCLVNYAHSYVPAMPTNSTQDAIAGGLSVPDISQLYTQWYPNGSHAIHVSYQLAGLNSSGLSKVNTLSEKFLMSYRFLQGALIQFSEEKVTDFTPPTSTPWVALIACDENATDASMDKDIFTLAHDKGAVSALLYSLYSIACVINPSYSDPASFDQVFDIFSSQSHTSSSLIELQFEQLSSQDEIISVYDSTRLNTSFHDIQRSLDTGNPVSSGYLLAVLRAYNSTNNSTMALAGSSNAATPNGSSSPKAENTGLALIILYAITGCVSALFCIVIISGAIRAIRNPERYGPRARLGEDGGPPQSRARGITRAILDTFPIVKFGTSQERSNSHGSGNVPDKAYNTRDPEANIQMGDLTPTNGRSLPSESSEYRHSAKPSGSGASLPTSVSRSELRLDAKLRVHPQSSPLGGRVPADAQGGAGVVAPGPSNISSIATELQCEDMVPASIGRETCPICIVDFEEGDDIRVLPCEGKHCFHQQCVDPWLLKLSSSCPICRHDFLALENMLSGHNPDEEDEFEPVDSQIDSTREHINLNLGRFSQYLRFARHRRHGDELDPTDPYMPTAPETSIYSGM